MIHVLILSLVLSAVFTDYVVILNPEQPFITTEFSIIGVTF